MTVDRGTWSERPGVLRLLGFMGRDDFSRGEKDPSRIVVEQEKRQLLVKGGLRGLLM